MFTQSKCIPCQGGIPPLGASEVQPFLKLLDKEINQVID